MNTPQANLEKRAYPRKRVNYKYIVSCQDKIFAGFAYDVSPGGIGFFSNDMLTPLLEAEIEFFLPEGDFQIQAEGKIVHCIGNPYASLQPDRYLIGLQFTKGLMDTLPDAAANISRHTPAHTIVINAPPARCFELLRDFERYPEWTSGVKKARVLERYPAGRGKRVEFQHDFFLRQVKYILDYFYDDDRNILSWTSAGADREILNITGSYTFTPRGNNSAFATYELDVTLSLVPSKRLVQYVTTILMRKEMYNFKKFVESNPA